MGLWLTPSPNTNRSGYALTSVLAAALVDQVSRTKMLTIPVATTRLCVAERRIEALDDVHLWLLLAGCGHHHSGGKNQKPQGEAGGGRGAVGLLPRRSSTPPPE